MEQRRKLTTAAANASHSAIASRRRVSAKAVESSKTVVSVSALQSTPQSVKKQSSKVSRSLMMNSPKSREDVSRRKKGGDVEKGTVPARTGNRAALKQFSRRCPSSTGSCTSCGDSHGMKSELHEKLCFAKDLIKDLQSQLLVLKAELQKSQSLNLELQSQNEKLARNLASAEAKFSGAYDDDQRESVGESQQPNAKNTRNLDNLNLKRTNESGINQESPPQSSNSCQNVRDVELKVPPPPPLQSLSRPVAAKKSPELIRLFHSLKKKEGKTAPQFLGKPAVMNAHNSIVGEIQNRSAHLLAIKSDIETKGEFINGLIDKVLVAAYTDIEDVLKFVDWLDSQLSTLADERAVLKHFKWPERKADAMREAAIEYRALKLLENEISSHKDDANTPCEAALKKMASLLDKSERSIQRLIRLRNTVVHSYHDLKLLTNWMLDSGIMNKASFYESGQDVHEKGENGAGFDWLFRQRSQSIGSSASGCTFCI